MYEVQEDQDVHDIDDKLYYKCPTCDLYVSDERPVSITYEDESQLSYDYPLGRVVKWYFLTHYIENFDGEMEKVPVFSEDIFTLKLGCMHETLWEAELSKGNQR